MLRDAATTCDAPRRQRDFTRSRDALAILTVEDETHLAEAMAEMAAEAASPPLVGLLESYGRIVRLQARLQALVGRLEQAQAHLAARGGESPSGRAQHQRLRAQCSDVIAELRDAKREACRRLGLAAPEPLSAA